MRYLGRGEGLKEEINKRKDLRKTRGIYTSYLQASKANPQSGTFGFSFPQTPNSKKPKEPDF